MSQEITLRKALQLKKSLTGEVAKLKANMLKYNSQDTPNRHINVEKIFAEYDSKVSNLVALKTAITCANVGVYGAIVQADELKAKIALYEELNVSEDHLKRNPDNTYSSHPSTVYLNYTDREEKVEEMKKKLQITLDLIDYFNSSTKISIDF